MIFLERAKFITDLVKNRNLIYHLARRDFKIKYARNYFGLAWAVLEPLALLVIMLIVFTFLRHRGDREEVPFAIYMLTGMAGFDFVSKGLQQATISIRSYSFMIKLLHIPTMFIPLISIMATFFTHLIVVGIAIIIIVLHGIGFSWYWFQLVYFMFASWMFLTGITRLTASIVIFIQDLQYIIGIVMRGMFFLTPIFWSIEMFPEQYRIYFKLNPLYHIVEGYRMSLLYHKPFWSDGVSLLSFWIVTIFFLIAGTYVFKKLSPNFADAIH
jgi:lipopolysaccharide transport system permease protein/teichoic acid transport system permease protein